MITFVPLEYYTLFYYLLFSVFCVITGFYYLGQPGCKKLLVQNSGIFPALIVLLLTIYVGLRPISGRYFADMFMYAYGYKMRSSDYDMQIFNINQEWFFELIMKTCMKAKVDVHNWFLLVDIFYFGTHLWACKKLLKENLWMAILFVFFSYEFFSFGTNGLRNGMACGLITLAIAYFSDRNTKGYLFGIFLSLLAMGCHRSVIIPLVSVFASLFFIKRIKTSVIVWVFCIFLSLVVGKSFQSLFMSLGFDDRVVEYSMSRETRFSHLGFRWDFLLYSSVPVIFAIYVEHKRIVDRTFTLLANTYILANSIWVLVCRMAFSNRIAYLSWFLYALVIAYGVIRVPIWKDQDRVAGWFVMGHAAFTMGMFLLGK